VLILLTRNPVYLVLLLILVFFNAAALLFLFNVDFLALTFIIIYVGAIAILFLFVVMMLNVKVYETQLNFFFFLIFFTFLFISLYFLLNKSFSSWQFDGFNFYYSFFDALTNIDLLGQILFNYFLVCFLIAGFVLLLAIIGPVVLTLNFNTFNKMNKIRALTRSDKFLSIFY
jgi:NADH-quinone oxidoreductase subunit J